MTSITEYQVGTAFVWLIQRVAQLGECFATTDCLETAGAAVVPAVIVGRRNARIQTARRGHRLRETSRAKACAVPVLSFERQRHVRTSRRRDAIAQKSLARCG